MTKVQLSGNKITKLIKEFLEDLDQEKAALWALDCAEHVLQYFENIYPGDLRPRTAIETGRAWVSGEVKVSEVRTAAFSAHAAAREATNDGAKAAARSAGQAAATAHIIGHAIHAANYAAKAAAYAASSKEAKSAAIKEQEWQYQLLLDLFKDTLVV